MNIWYLLHDSLLVVIAQRATELVVVHGWTVLLHAPQPGNLGGVKIVHYVYSSDNTSLHCTFPTSDLWISTVWPVGVLVGE